jgi:hypothetical protein
VNPATYGETDRGVSVASRRRQESLQKHYPERRRRVAPTCGLRPSLRAVLRPWGQLRKQRAIEEAFSKVKLLLRKAKARSFEALVQATGRALLAVSEDDARGFFTHRGYQMPRAPSL